MKSLILHEIEQGENMTLKQLSYIEGVVFRGGKAYLKVGEVSY